MDATKRKPLELEDLYQPAGHGRGTFIRKLGLERLYSPDQSEWVNGVTVNLLELLAGCQWHNTRALFPEMKKRIPGLDWIEFTAIYTHMQKSGEIEMRQEQSPSWENELRLFEDCALY